MEVEYRFLSPEDLPRSTRTRFALDVLEGLSGKPRQISPVYLYDRTGSELFRAITTLEEYTIPACEVEILSRCREKIADLLPREPFNLVELGAGDGHKSILLLDHFLGRDFQFDYIPLDISVAAIHNLVLSLRKMSFGSTLKVSGVIAEYFDGLKWLGNVTDRRNVLLFLGSNIGNFDPAGMRRFLRHLWKSLRPDDMVLIGLDLKKDIEVLNHAYNDSRGITREFNLNLLDRINRELGGNFKRDRFTFHSSYNIVSGAVESFLVSLEPQEVFIGELGRSFTFEAWEGIKTENSHKFTVPEIFSLAAETGFTVVEQFFDSRNYFVDSLWKVEKSRVREIAPGLAAEEVV